MLQLQSQNICKKPPAKIYMYHLFRLLTEKFTPKPNILPSKLQYNTVNTLIFAFANFGGFSKVNIFGRYKFLWFKKKKLHYTVLKINFVHIIFHDLLSTMKISKISNVQNSVSMFTVIDFSCYATITFLATLKVYLL